MVKRIYSEGTLSTVLVQKRFPGRPQSHDHLQQTVLLSPTQETVLKSPVALPGTTDPKEPNHQLPGQKRAGTEQGAEWLADMPNQTAVVQVTCACRPLSSSVIYKLIWDAGAKAAEFSLAQTLSGTQTSVKSATTGCTPTSPSTTFAYRGPVAGASRFEIISNLGILELKQGIGSDPAIPNQDPRYLRKTTRHIGLGCSQIESEQGGLQNCSRWAPAWRPSRWSASVATRWWFLEGWLR